MFDAAGGGRTAVLPDRGRDLPAAMGTLAVHERTDVPFSATRNAEAQADTQAPPDGTASMDFSI